MKKLNKNNSGFSHFEIVLLVVVIAVIATVGFFVYNKNNNKSKADSAVASAAQPVSCKVTGIVSKPAYGSVQSPIVTIYNKSGKTFIGQIVVELQLNNNGDGTIYDINSGNIKIGTSKSLKLRSFRVPYADKTSSFYGTQNTNVIVLYNDPVPPNKRSFSCWQDFTLPKKPV